MLKFLNVILFVVPINLIAQAEFLDYSFADNGIFRTNTQGSFDQAKAIAVQNDGKVVVAGVSSNNLFNDGDIALCRYNPDGTFDEGFGFFGRVVTNVFGNYDEATAIAIQSNNKIVVAGSAYNEISGKYFIVLVRYNSDGSEDNTFGVNGIVTTSLGVAIDSHAYGIAIQSDGKIVVVGRGDGLALVRYNSNGSLDNSFDGDGIVQTKLGLTNGITGNHLVIHPNGNIIVTGSGIFDIFQNIWSLFVCRFTANGSIDNTFGSSGKTIFNFAGNDPNSSSYGVQLGILSSNKLVVTGVRKTSNINSVGIVQFSPNGLVDSSFGTNGQSIVKQGIPRSLSVQPGGKLVIGGTASNTLAPDRLFVARYNSNGSLDTTFGSNGIQENYIDQSSSPGSNLTGYAVSLSDGRIIQATGASVDGGANVDIVVLRYTANGLLDSSFGNSGSKITPYSTSTDQGKEVILLDNGGIYILGSSSLNDTKAVVVRLNPDGSPNQFYGKNGNVILEEWENYQGYPISFDIEKDGSLVVGSSVFFNGNFGLSMIRVSENGAVHPFFGTMGGWDISLGLPHSFTVNVKVDNSDRILVACGNQLTNQFILVRLNSFNGDLDPSFGNSGKVVIDYSSISSCESIALQEDGKIILAGNTYLQGVNKITVVRLNQNGTLDNTFGVNGKVVTDVFGSLDELYARDVAIQEDKKIVVVGSASSFNYGTSYAVLRYTSSGSLDNTFGDKGIFKIPVTDVSIYPKDVAKQVEIQNDGKIIICGSLGTSSEDAVGIVRCNSDGTLDSSFGNGGVIVTDDPSSGYDGLGVGLGIQNDGKIVVVGSGYHEFGITSQLGISAFRYNSKTTKISDLHERSKELIVFPNPMTSSATVSPVFSLNDATMFIYDVNGRTVSRLDHLYGDKVQFNRSGILSGTYRLLLMEEENLISETSFSIVD